MVKVESVFYVEVNEQVISMSREDAMKLYEDLKKSLGIKDEQFDPILKYPDGVRGPMYSTPYPLPNVPYQPGIVTC